MGKPKCRQCGNVLQLPKPSGMDPELCIFCFAENTAKFYKNLQRTDTLETIREKALACGLTGDTVDHLVELRRKRQAKQTNA